jgi:3-oxosteroid 1-dehydrogenase
VQADSIAELAAKTASTAPVWRGRSSASTTFAAPGSTPISAVARALSIGATATRRSNPIPNLGAIEKAPFYAVRMYPGDVGTAGGVVTDEYARVLRDDGSVIAGLYATGNCTASVVGRCYPGAGASIGASFAFGYIAAHHAAGVPVA